jgi:hypothetical protein
MFSRLSLVFLSLVLVGLILMGCTADEVETKEVVPPEAIEPVVSEVIEGDFTLRITSEKNIYRTDENVEILAEIKYTGDQDEIKVFYNSRYILAFTVVEKERNISLPFIFHNTIRTITLKKDEWFEQTYRKDRVNFPPNDPNTEFYEAFRTGRTFPEGDYEIKVSGWFSEDEEDFIGHVRNEPVIGTKISIKVIE